MKQVAVIIMIFFAAGCYAPRLVYVTASEGSVAVVDTDRMEKIATFEVRGGPWGIAPSRSWSRVYVANFWGNSVVGIDTGTNAIEERIHCYFPWGIAVKPRGK